MHSFCMSNPDDAPSQMLSGVVLSSHTCRAEPTSSASRRAARSNECEAARIRLDFYVHLDHGRDSHRHTM